MDSGNPEEGSLDSERNAMRSRAFDDADDFETRMSTVRQ